MIIVKFFGGLGNQMFQYATYLALKNRYKDVTVTADLSWYNTTTIHNGFELEHLFEIKLNVFLGNKHGRTTIMSKYFYRAISLFAKEFFKRSLFNKFEFIEDTSIFNKKLFHLNKEKHYYLDGSWGNERYFEDVKDLILKDFTFKEPLDILNNKWRAELTSVESTSIHIRRGDYVTYNKIFIDLCNTDYYSSALNFIQQQKGNLKFYIFSDDSQWCKDNLSWLKNIEYKFINQNSGKNSFRDMQLMALCKNNVIANSTFSWWAAWLNSNKPNIVICPMRLFHDNHKNTCILAELYPSEWIVK